MNYVYFKDAATDSPGAEAVVPAAKLGVNESANYEYDEDAATDSPGAEAVVPAAKLDGVNVSVNETLAADHRRMNYAAKTGEEACENHDFSYQECKNVGCCQWAECPGQWAGLGQCHSAARVQNGQCTSVPWESHYEDGPHCWNSWGWGWG